MLLPLALLAVPMGAKAEPAAPRISPPECRTHVGYDRDTDVPGYLLPTKLGPRTCIPFTATATPRPADYRGDFYVKEFTDAKIAARWQDCQKDPACAAPIDKHAAARQPPNKERKGEDAHVDWLVARPPLKEPLDLKLVRRPGFFATVRGPEEIASVEPRTYTVEFTVPAEPYERLIRHEDTPVKLRGWWLRGAGVPDGKGGRKRAVVILSGGGGIRVAALEDPSDRLYDIDPKTGKSILRPFPTNISGSSGARDWRTIMLRLNQAGFDVLSYDRRGVGMSTGFSDTNTLQQGRDLLDVVGALRTGKGLRVFTPKQKTLAGKAAAQALLGSVRGDQLPVLLSGSSRGTMATGWAMARNFYKTCDYDLSPEPTCGPPVGYRNIKGAIQVADYTAGPGYQTADTNQDDRQRQLFMGATVEKYHIVFFPSSAILESVPTWPALFIGRGTYDYAESLEGSIEAYDRTHGLKELVVVRGPHPMETWPRPELHRLIDRMIAFGTAAALDRKTAPGGRPWTTMKELAATAGDYWEPSSKPAAAQP